MLTTLALANARRPALDAFPLRPPILPIVLGAAAGEHRYGPLALAVGLALSFVAIGLFIATIGFSLGLTGDVFRIAAALLMVLIGLVLLIPQASMRPRRGRRPGGPVGGEPVWRVLLDGPSGPVRGRPAARRGLEPLRRADARRRLGVAAKGENLGQVALTMLVFGIGAGLPLAILGSLSREALLRWRNRMLAAGSRGKMIFGLILLAAGLLVITGLDKRVGGRADRRLARLADRTDDAVLNRRGRLVTCNSTSS